LPLLRVVERKGIFDIEIGKNFAPYKSVWVDKKYDANEYGTQLINSMVPNNDFDFPKSLWNVYECLYATLKNKPDSIVVDFFAGSGTTGHAVEMLNKLLGGTRKYILATNNAIGENKEKEFSKLFGKVEDYPNEYSAYEEKYGICSSITYPRMLAVNNGYVHTKDTKDVLFEKKFSKRVFDSIDQIKLEIDIIIQKFEGRYEKIDYVFENDCIKLIGIHKKGESVPGIPHNIKYYKTDFIDKVKDGTVTNSLLDHIKELIQLEHGFKIDDEKIVMVLNEDDLDLRFTRDLSKCQSLFKPSFVQLTLPQKQQLNNLNITPIDIPEYYFRNELMEVEEL
jgi:adenine-specific DNA-methyltransferase